MDPLKYLYQKPVLVGRVTKWVVMLSEFDLTYISKKTVKGRAVVQFLADLPVEGEEEGEFTFLDEDIVEIHAENPWRLYFDRAANQKGYGIGIVLVAPDKSCMPLSIRLNFEATNNMAEYEACVVGLEALITLGAREVDVFGDSLLVISHAQGIWKTKDEKLRKYIERLEEMATHFDHLTFSYLPRSKNQFADALATLASFVDIPVGAEMTPLTIEQREEPCYCNEIMVRIEDGLPWYTNIKNFIEKGEFPIEADKKGRRSIRLLAMQYVICGGRLYRRSYDGIQQLCVEEAEAEKIMEEVHVGICGSHMNGRMLVKKIILWDITG